MPSTTQDYSQIKEYQEKAASLNKEAAGMNATAFTLPDTIMKAVQEDRTQRGVSKLATDTGNVMGQMVSDPNAIREGSTSLSAQGLVDPFSVNALTSGARAQNLRTLGTVSTQLEQNQGSLDEVINAGANQLKARAATLLAQAEEATSQANSLQQVWDRMMEEKKFQEDIRQFNETQSTKGSGSGETKFYSAIEDGINQLKDGESWGVVFNRIKSRFPEYADSIIDAALGKGQWYQGGAYEEYLRKQKAGKEVTNPFD
jgi:exonuclease VII small subunit